jgi:hypothetical protein
MKKETKATRIRKLLRTGASASTVAKTIKCNISYVYQVNKEVDKNATAETTGVLERPNALDHWENVPKSILDEAQGIIWGDREKTYGAPDKNLKAIAGYWANHLHTRFGVYHDITYEDVCIMMTLLKLARLANDPKHEDSARDGIGYLALLDRIHKGV